MVDIDSHTLSIFISIFDVSHSSRLLLAVGIVDECPKTFDVGREVDVIDDVDVSINCVTGCEVIIALTLPNCK